MASSTNPYTSFTITQAFLGAPLQFQPTLESKEMQELIDLYVTGSASKQNKLSEITLDFFNNAVVDINTGALTRTYHVTSQWSASFEQSPLSQSSGSSPMFMTSPDSSSNLGGSTYGSSSMTPPTNARGRIVKKAKKPTKKAEEIRLPGFSIMTRDGIDITSSAGRGTKTKEQREHAHLMRIMKACPSCKRKKIRCDPAHRRSDDMSRTVTNSSFSSSSTAASPSKPSPTTTMPSLTPQTSNASAGTPSFSPLNAIDDFVLFPESTWDTDKSLSGLDTQDLGGFNFDISELNNFNEPIWNLPYNTQLSTSHLDSNLGHTPDQYGLDQWASSIGGGAPVHTRPNSSLPAGGSGGFDPSFRADWLHDVSPMTELRAQGFFHDSSLQVQPIQNVTTDASPLSSTSDWGILAASIYASPAPQRQADTPESSLSSDSSQIRTRNRPASAEDGTESTLLAHQRGSAFGIEVDPSDAPHPGGLDQSSSSGRNVPGAPATLRRSQVQLSELEALPSETSFTTTGFATLCQLTITALQMESSGSSESSLSPQTERSGSTEVASLVHELQHLQAVLQQASNVNAGLSGSQAQLQTMGSLLCTISNTGAPRPSRRRYNKLDPESRPDFVRECQIHARRLARSLCATINDAETQNDGISPIAAGPMLVSGRNVHLSAPEPDANTHSLPDSLDSGVSMWVESTSQWQLSSIGGSSYSMRSGVTFEESMPTADSVIVSNGRGRTSHHSQSEVVAQANTIGSFDIVPFDPSPASTFLQKPSLLQDQNVGAASQLMQTNSLVRNTEVPQEFSLAVQTNLGASYAGLQAQSSVVSQLVLPLLATIFASCVATSIGVRTSLSSGLQYFFASFALSYLLPAPKSITHSIFNLGGTVVAAIAVASLHNNLDYFRQTSSQWLGSNHVVAVVKLTLVAVITAQLPYIIGRIFEADSTGRLGLAVMSFLSRNDSHGRQSASLLSVIPSSEKICSISRREGNSMSSWLAGS